MIWAVLIAVGALLLAVATVAMIVIAGHAVDDLL